MSRSGVLTFLNAVQRPFDLAGQIWLGVPAPLLAHFIISVSLAGVLAWFWRPKAAGILSGIVILAKEGVDLTIIALNEPLTWAFASGSVVDLPVSFAGVGLGLWVASKVRRASVEATEAESGHTHGPDVPAE